MTKPDPWQFDSDGGFDTERMNAQIAAWAGELGLGSWEIRFSTEPPSTDDERGSVDMHLQVRQAAIRLDSAIPAGQVDRTIVHELLHVLMCGVEDTFTRAMPAHGEETQAFLRGQWEREQEWAIERLASLVTGTTREHWASSPRPDDPKVWRTAFNR